MQAACSIPENCKHAACSLQHPELLLLHPLHPGTAKQQLPGFFQAFFYLFIMLIPKNRKYRKAQKSVKKSLRSGRYPHYLTFGTYGLKALNSG
jgi:hypothetical protein